MTKIEKHTPGPWEVVAPGEWRIGSGYGVRARTPEGPGWPTPSATGYYAMCEPPPHGNDRKAEQKANAYLIAAAPDMLAALKQSEIAVEQLCIDQDPANQCWITLAEARAAIAKAEGR